MRSSEGGDLVVSSELSADSLAAREEARERVRAGLARANPRDFVLVEKKLLAEVSRPAFAEQAFYSLPRKKRDPATGAMVEIAIEGLSIRFAETAGRLMRNLLVHVRIVSETQNERLVEVEVVDLEANFSEIVQGVVAKVEERRGFKNRKTGEFEPPSNAGEVVRQRFNSYGDVLFICRVPEEQMLIRTNSLAARLRRNKILEMVPADIKEACLETARAVKQAAAEKDLREDAVGTRKKMFGAFSKVNVTEPELRTYVTAKWKVPVERLGAAQLNELRSIRTAISEGRVTFAELLAEEVEDNAAVDTRVGAVVSAPDVKPQEAPTAPTPKPEAVEAAKERQPSLYDQVQANAALRAADEAAKLQAAADQPPPKTPPPPPEPGSPPVGTAEFAVWLEEKLKNAPTALALKALSRRIAEAPKEYVKNLTAIYLTHPNRGAK